MPVTYQHDFNTLRVRGNTVLEGAGAIDGVTIGANTAAAITGTIITASTELRTQTIDTNAAAELVFQTSGGVQAKVAHVGSAVNFMRTYGGATGSPVTIDAQGTDTDVGIALIPKGSEHVRFGTHAAITAETLSGFVTIRDIGGTQRKLAVVS